MTKLDAQAVLTFADCNMNAAEASRRMYMHRNTVIYHLDKVKRETGLDGRCFYDLAKLLKIAKEVLKVADSITRQQLQMIEDAALYGKEEFHRVLEKYTGIEARPYTAYLYYDDCGNFIGNSDGATVESLLEAAYVEVKDD